MNVTHDGESLISRFSFAKLEHPQRYGQPLETTRFVFKTHKVMSSMTMVCIKGNVNKVFESLKLFLKTLKWG